VGSSFCRCTDAGCCQLIAKTDCRERSCSCRRPIAIKKRAPLLMELDWIACLQIVVMYRNHYRGNYMPQCCSQ
jgi:hypothetical protein